MATRTWLAVDGNWANTANWSGGAVPVDADDVVINYGTIDITSGLNQAGINLKSLNITKGFQASIGTAGTSLTIGIDDAGATSFRYASDRGFLYIAPTTALIFYIDQASGGSGVSITGGTLSHATSIACGLNGSVRIGSGATVTGAVTCGIGIQIETPLAGTVGLYGGNHTANVNLGTVTVGSGASLTTSLAATITAGTLHGRATLTANSSGTIAALTALPGSTFRPGGAKDLTVTTLNRYAGSNITLKTEGATVTVTNDLAFGVK